MEQQDFEAHYFSCAECSEDLRTGAILVDNSRALLREEFFDPLPAGPGVLPRRAGWPLWWFQLPLAAAIGLVFVVGYQNLKVIPDYRRELAETSGAVVPQHFALRPAVRGAVPVIGLAAGTRFFEIRAEEVEPATGGYHCAIRDSQGRIITEVSAPSVESGEKLVLLLDSRQTPPGQYVLVISSSQGIEIGQYPFTIEMR